MLNAKPPIIVGTFKKMPSKRITGAGVVEVSVADLVNSPDVQRNFKLGKEIVSSTRTRREQADKLAG